MHSDIDRQNIYNHGWDDALIEVTKRIDKKNVKKLPDYRELKFNIKVDK